MTSKPPQVVDIMVRARFTGEIRGKAARRVLVKAGVPKLYNYRPPSGGSACWTFPAKLLGDVLAAGEVCRGVTVALQHEQEALPL